MKTFLTAAFFLAVAMMAGTSLLVAVKGNVEGNSTGLITIDSPHDVPTTVANVQSELTAAGFGIPLILDHQANAASVGKTLRPMVLVVFGNPNVGTQFMQDNQLAGIDLPQKYLVYEDAEGNTKITYNDPFVTLKKRHGFKNKQVLSNVDAALTRFATLAAN
jgi:uncharacterized protein (DUF302 family)